MRRAIRWLALGAASAAFFFALTSAPASAQSTAAFVDQAFLQPHHSEITGDMLVDAWRWYGVPVRWSLAILGAETSMGDPRLGGHLVAHHNYGCMRAFAGWRDTRWGELADGTVEVAGKTWLSFPTAEAGVMAWGRYMKLGVRGRYAAHFDDAGATWIEPVYRIYYGASVPGLEHHMGELRAIDASVTRRAAAAGFVW